MKAADAERGGAAAEKGGGQARAERLFSRRNEVYRLEDGTIEKRVASEALAQAEAARLKGLRGRGVATPAVLGVRGAALYLEACPGEPLPDFLTHAYGEGVLRGAACTIAAWFEDFYRAVGHEKSGANRGDVNGRNFLVSGEGVWGVDFEEDAHGAREQDAGRLIAFVRTYRLPDRAAQEAFAFWLRCALIGRLGLDEALTTSWETREYAAMEARRARRAGMSAPAAFTTGGEFMRERYDRQMGMPGIGEAGQGRLAASRAAVIGAGGLGSALLFALAGAGIGDIAIIDADTVSMSNLNRQFLYAESDIGAPKATIARRRLEAYNSSIQFADYVLRVDAHNVEALIADRDIVILAVDNIETRLLAGDEAYRQGIPIVDGGVNGWMGSVLAVSARTPPCLRCFYGDSAGQGEPAVPGALGAVVSTIASMQAAVALRMLLGMGDPLDGKLLLWEAERMSFMRVARRARPGCSTCGGEERAGIDFQS